MRGTSRPSSRIQSRKLLKSKMDDLPDAVVIEILCRLPSSRLIFQCMCVCKRWFSLIFDPYCIGYFVILQIEKQTPITRTLINYKGEEFLNRMSSSSSSPIGVTAVLKRIKSFYSLKEEPDVVGTYNDLVLCCEPIHGSHNYYICNPYTMQWVAVPPAPTRGHDITGVGFICDSPFYDIKEDQKGHAMLNIYAEYRCKVVRILPPDDSKDYSLKFNVEIFSSETGTWRESVVSSPIGIIFNVLDPIGFAYNGMLYWYYRGQELLLALGMDPFNENNTASASSSCSRSTNGETDDHKCFTVFDEHVEDCYTDYCLADQCLGCLKMCTLECINRGLYVDKFKELLDREEIEVEMLAFDPNNKDILYLRLDGEIVMCNIRTRKWLTIVEKSTIKGSYFLPFVLPWWPTPVPGLPQHAHQLAHGGH